MKRFLTFIVISGLSFFYPPLSSAQEDLLNTVELKSRHIYSSDVTASSGEIDITESGVEYSHGYNLKNGLPINFSIDIKHIDINHDNLSVPIPNHLESRSIGLGTKFPVPFIGDNKNYFIGLDTFPTFNTDTWDAESHNFRIPSRTYLIYKRNDNFMLVAGFWYLPQYDTQFLPIIGMIYKPNDKLSFNLASSHPNITYQLNEKTKALLEFNFISEEYQVTRGTQDDVSLKYRETTTGVGFEHQFTKNLLGSVSVGGVFGRKLHYYEDNNGKVIPDSGIYTSASLSAKF